MTRRIATAALAGAVMPMLAAAGCLSTPPYQPETRVSYAQDGTGATVAGTAAGFELHFASGSGFHFPDALRIDGTDILGHEQMPPCYAENEAGLVISPTPRISADSGTPITNQLDPMMRGPAVVQMKLSWTTRFDCNSARAPGGTSTFTVFPDGRIVRHDTLSDPASDSISASQCTCDAATGPQAFTIASYWEFARTALLDFFPSANERQDLPESGSAISTPAISCLAGSSYQVASAWEPPDPENATTTHGTVALVGFRRQQAIDAPMIDPLSWDTSTAIFVERGGCAKALDRASEYAAPPSLMINGKMAPFALHDGIYGGDSGGGPPGFPLDTNRAMLTGPVKSSFAVWLRFPSSVDAVRARLAGQSGPWYVPQQVDDRTWIVWFRDPLMAGQTIVIEPF